MILITSETFKFDVLSVLKDDCVHTNSHIQGNTVTTEIEFFHEFRDL